jgi:hypothetical protein
VGVHGDLILGGITNQSLVVGERYIGWRCAITLVVGNDLYTVILPYTNAAKGRVSISVISMVAQG